MKEKLDAVSFFRNVMLVSWSLLQVQKNVSVEFRMVVRWTGATDRRGRLPLLPVVFTPEMLGIDLSRVLDENALPLGDDCPLS